MFLVPKRLISAIAVCGLFGTEQVGARAVIVPDEFSSIQAAIDSKTDTVLVRDGSYAETPSAYRGVVIQGIGDRRPRLDGLAVSNPDPYAPRRWVVRDIDFTGLVTVNTSNWQARNLDMYFMSCGLGAGLRHDIDTSSDPRDINALVLEQCRMGGPSVLRAANFVMHSDTLDGGVYCSLEEGLTVQNCWFRGGPDAALEIQNDELGGLIENNLIEDHGIGIYVFQMSHLVIRSNVVRRIAGTGIYMSGEGGVIAGNQVSDCVAGIRFSTHQATVIDNTCVRVQRTGIWLDETEQLRFERNAVGHCGEFGLVIESAYSGAQSLIQNTFFNNGRSGISVQYGTDNKLALERNIFFANSEWGLLIQAPQAEVALVCNDWFGNGSGVASGTPESLADLGVDPLFCNVANDDVTLFAGSPLVSQSACGQIGARGVGCSVTATTLTRLTATGEDGRIAIRWGFGSMDPVDSWVERALMGSGPWDSLGTGSRVTGQEYVLLDGEVTPDQTYFYRVAWLEQGAVVRSAPVGGKVGSPGPLSAVMPNPSRRGVDIEWTLSSPRETDIRVYDLSGREIATVVNRRYEAGTHRARWDGQTASGEAAPIGWYLVRVEHGGAKASHRVLLIR